MIKRDAIRVELQALPDKQEWILSAKFSIERGAKILREPDKALEDEIANASAALKEMIYAELYAELRRDVANVLTMVHGLPLSMAMVSEIGELERALELLRGKLK